MPRRSLLVTPKDQTDYLPHWATEYVAMVNALGARGVLGEVSERLQVARRDGYSSLDAFLFLLAYFSSGLKIGLRPFAALCAPYSRQLAAVGGRRHWASSSAMSRLLASLTSVQVDEFGAWLLGEAVGAYTLEAHPSIVCRDTRGEQWQVFDYDPTVTTLRHRGLPLDPDLPAPERRSCEMAAQGYAGRKRGDVQFSRATLQHAGSGLWIGIWMGPGNGAHRRDNERAYASAKSWCARTGADLERAVVRSDGGAGGSVPAMTDCRESGVHYVTRLARYTLLEHEQVQQHLSGAVWEDVEDSLSGPKREATELGTMQLSADRESLRDDGEPYGNIETRIVITRTPIPDESGKRGAGIAKDGWWYELFATSVPASHWPAPELVSLYYGRTGQENRFHQEDRELGLDRIFSYHLPGQQLANLVGLFLWNERTARGAELVAPMSGKLPAQPARKQQSSAPTSPEGPSNETEQNAPASERSDAASSERQSEPATTEIAKEMQPGSATEVRGDDDLRRPLSSVEKLSRHLAKLNQLNWNHQFQNLPGWRWDETLGLVCPNNMPLGLHSMANTKDGSLLIRWRGRGPVCRDCAVRTTCSSSQSTSFRKDIWFTFAPDDSEAITELAKSARPAPALHDRLLAERNRSGSNTPWRPTPGATESGSLQVAWPILVPSALRYHFTVACSRVRAEVTVRDPTRRLRSPPFYFAYTAADRQQRRKTWSWRRKYNELPEDAEVVIVLHGARHLAPILGDTNQARKAA